MKHIFKIYYLKYKQTKKILLLNELPILLLNKKKLYRRRNKAYRHFFIHAKSNSVFSWGFVIACTLLILDIILASITRRIETGSIILLLHFYEDEFFQYFNAFIFCTHINFIISYKIQNEFTVFQHNGMISTIPLIFFVQK